MPEDFFQSAPTMTPIEMVARKYHPDKFPPANPPFVLSLPESSVVANANEHVGDVANLLSKQLFFAAAFAVPKVGAMIIGLPPEVLKLRKQASLEGTTYVEIARTIQREEGIPGFFKGFTPMALRAGLREGMRGVGLNNVSKYCDGFYSPETLARYPHIGYMTAYPFMAIAETAIFGPVDRYRILSSTSSGKWSALNRMQEVFHEKGAVGLVKDAMHGSRVVVAEKLIKGETYHLASQELERHVKERRNGGGLSEKEKLAASFFIDMFITILHMSVSNLKTVMMQKGSVLDGTFTSAAKHVYNGHGMAGFFNGLNASMVHGVVNTVMYGVSIEMTKSKKPGRKGHVAAIEVERKESKENGHQR